MENTRPDGQTASREGRYLDRESAGRKAVSACNGRHGKQIGPCNLGPADEIGKLPAAGRLTGKLARDARRMM